MTSVPTGWDLAIDAAAFSERIPATFDQDRQTGSSFQVFFLLKPRSC
jgi:hypothetical protein